MKKLHGVSHVECKAVIEALRELPQTYSFACKGCGADITHHAMDIYANCPRCGNKHKTRSFDAGFELQDVVGEALKWLSEGPDFERIISDREKFYLEDES